MNDVFMYDFVVGVDLPKVNSVVSASTSASTLNSSTCYTTTTGYVRPWRDIIWTPAPDYGTLIEHFNWYPQYVWAEQAFTKTKELFSSTSNFPPVNAFQQKDGSLLLEFAFAGYKKEDIAITYEGDTLVLSSEGRERPDYEKSREIKRGIKLSKFDIRYDLAPEHFDTGKTKAKFEDGLLSITIPLAESKVPKIVEIE